MQHTRVLLSKQLFLTLPSQSQLISSLFKIYMLCTTYDTDPVKVSKDVASLVVCTKKSFFSGACGFFVSDVISEGLLGHLGPLCLALGTNR